MIEAHSTIRYSIILKLTTTIWYLRLSLKSERVINEKVYTN